MHNFSEPTCLSRLPLSDPSQPNSFKYDPFGRRIYKSSSAGTNVYAYDGDNLIEETNSSGGATARYQFGLNIDEPLAVLQGSTTSYYQADGLGSITSLSNSSGANAQTYTYDSFGNMTASSGSLVNRFLYTGREFDSETSLYYYRARYYDPQAGRFLNEDPIGFEGGENFYAYVQNDPDDWGDFDGTQRDRGTTGRPDGTPNPFKKLKPDPDDPSKVIYRDPNTGKDTKKAKPPGFDDYWKKKHPQQQPKPAQCPTQPDKKQEPSKSVPVRPVSPCGPGEDGADWCMPNRQPFSPFFPWSPNYFPSTAPAPVEVPAFPEFVPIW